MRLLAVHAHPDDESSKAAATCARYAAEGHEVTVLTCTGGERGEVLNPSFPQRVASMEEMGRIRRAEMAEAARILGVQHRWLGFVDSGMDAGALPQGCFALQPPDRVLERMVAHVRALRPHVIVTYDENGGYPHPDHIATHRAAVVAFDAAANPAVFPEAGDPWQPRKLYYVHIVTKDRVRALHDGLLHHGMDSPFSDWLAGWDDAGNRPVTARVRCEQYFERRNRALLAHASQVDPASSWFAVPLEIQQAAWPTEEFELARSVVPTIEAETCLFAGLADADAPTGAEVHSPTTNGRTYVNQLT